MRRSLTTLLSTASAMVLLAACGTDGAADDAADPAAGSTSSAPTSAPTTEQPPSPSATASESAADDAPPFPAGTGEQAGDGSGRPDLVLTDVRVAEHDGYDRMVLEFRGTGTPGWQARYVDRAVMDGSGEVVRLDGDAVLDVYASGTTYPAEGGSSYGGPRRLAGAGALAETYVVGTFEGDTQVLAGIAGARAPFRVFTLTGPPRLVVDVADPS